MLGYFIGGVVAGVALLGICSNMIESEK